MTPGIGTTTSTKEKLAVRYGGVMVLVGSKFLFRFRFIPIYYNGKNGMIKRKRNQKLLSTRKHSSRMHTTRFSHLGVGASQQTPRLDRDTPSGKPGQRPPARNMGPGTETP